MLSYVSLFIVLIISQRPAKYTKFDSADEISKNFRQFRYFGYSITPCGEALLSEAYIWQLFAMVPIRKFPTRGAKQIIDENTKVINFCQWLVMGSSSIRIVLSILMNIRTLKSSLDSLTWEIVLSNTLLPISLIILSLIMRRMSKPVYSEDQRVLYAGYDLNVRGGWGEIFREVMLVITLAHIFSAISTWCRYVLWYLPLKIFYLCYKTTVYPTVLQFLIENKMITEGNEEERYYVKPKKNKKKIKYLRTIRHWHNFKC